MSLRRRIGRALAPLIYSNGWVLVPSSRNNLWPEHRFLRRFLTGLNVDCVLDVGANVGQFGEELRMIGYTGLIFSFEPDPSCFSDLKAASSNDFKWFVFNKALGDKPGTSRLNRMKMPVFNSFLNPAVNETDSFSKINVTVDTVDVEVDTVNRVLPDIMLKHNVNNVFLKMDTQGYDLNVFRGASEQYGAICALKSEMAIKRIYENVPVWSDLIEQYTVSGFEVAGLFPVNPHLDEVVEVDCYMKRKP